MFIVDEYSAEAILRSNEYITKSFGYQFFVPWLGEGVLIATDDKWRARRKILTASFHYRILENFCTMMNDVIDDFTNSIGDIVRKNSIKSFDFLEELNKLSLQIICHTAMGYRMKFDDPKGC